MNFYFFIFVLLFDGTKKGAFYRVIQPIVNLILHCDKVVYGSGLHFFLSMLFKNLRLLLAP